MAASTGHVAKINMAAQIGDAIEMVSILEVLKITMDSAAPKNVILLKVGGNEPPLHDE